MVLFLDFLGFIPADLDSHEVFREFIEFLGTNSKHFLLNLPFFAIKLRTPQFLEAGEAHFFEDVHRKNGVVYEKTRVFLVKFVEVVL